MEPRLSFSALRCVACGTGGLECAEDALLCPSCGRLYPILAGLPVMFSDAVPVRGPLLEPAVVRTVLRAMDLPADTGNMLRVRQASGARAIFGDTLVATESAQFLRRLHTSGYPIPAQLLDPPDDPQPEQPPGEPRCRWLADYIPRLLAPGERLQANIRFENTGPGPMRHDGHGRGTIAFAWRNAAGDSAPVEDLRTPLPVDLPPGQAMTLPVRLVAPAIPGRYTLTLQFVLEGLRWLEPAHGPLTITVREGARFVPPAHWRINANEPSDYLADQARGIAILQDWLARSPDPAALRMLEIGGNAKPILGYLPGESYNVDVDLLGLQVGCVVRRARGNFVQVVCADARRLPFAERFFDAIIMFASLHHLPDPAALLRGLRPHLRPGGFIGIFCEPVGQVWPGVVPQAFAEELRRGVNEQGFSLAEYAQIFAAAGLEAEDLVLDHNSLKARLVPVPVDA